MPKVAAYTLAWFPARQAYILHHHQTEVSLAFEPDLSAWHAWLERATSFAFRGQRGTYTARREQVKQGDWYWYAYQRSRGRVRKKYLGKSAALTLQRLEEIAERFNDGEHTDKRGMVGSPLPARTSSAAREQILAAKLRAPFAAAHSVMRPRLLADLQKASMKPVTLVSAPAGSGKSTLLSNWLRQSSPPFAWISLDQYDNDGALFWSYLFTALETLYPGAGEWALEALHHLQPARIERVLMPLINRIGDGEPWTRGKEARAGEAFLILDDYHAISDAAIHQGMAFLLEHLPPRLHLIIATRSDPPLPLARLLVGGRLLELRANDLRFSREETAALFARQAGISLSSAELTLLEERTAGWAAGLQMVALLTQEQRETPGILHSIHGSQHYLVEYLGQEVLAGLPESVQHFLVRTSLLKQLEGGLCEAVSDQPGGAETLDRLFQANLFLLPLDESHRWYRYHPVFAALLRQRLQQSGAERIAELHRRASRWYRAQGMLVEAVDHAHAANDLESIANIAEVAGVELISRGETRLVMNWVAMLPRSLVFSRLRLFLYDCWWHWHLGHTTVVGEMLREYSRQHELPGLEVEDAATLEAALEAHIDELYPRAHWDHEQRANRIAEMLALYGVLLARRLDRGDLSQELCQRAAFHVAGLAHRSRILLHLGTVSLLRGDFAGAAAALEEALASAITDGSVTWLTSNGYRLVMLYEMLGQLSDVARVAQTILQLAAGKAFLTRGTAYIFVGGVEYEHNHLEAAEHAFERAITTCLEIDPTREIDPDVHLLLGYLRLARIKLLHGERNETCRYLDEVNAYLARCQVGAEILPVVRGEYALLLYQLGDETAGQRWLAEYPPAAQRLDDQFLPQQGISLSYQYYRICTKFLLITRRWQEAEQVLQAQQPLAERQGRTGSLIQWLILRALLAQTRGKDEQALFAITRALSLAERRGYLRTFLDEGAPLLALLSSLQKKLRGQRGGEKALPTPGYLKRLILLLKQEQQPKLPPGEHSWRSLVEQLSKREYEVLHHINEGYSDREIAGRLVIAPSTVKSHVRAIYTKLGVESRTQALARARKLNLL